MAILPDETDVDRLSENYRTLMERLEEEEIEDLFEQDAKQREHVGGLTPSDPGVRKITSDDADTLLVSRRSTAATTSTIYPGYTSSYTAGAWLSAEPDLPGTWGMIRMSPGTTPSYTFSGGWTMPEDKQALVARAEASPYYQKQSATPRSRIEAALRKREGKS